MLVVAVVQVKGGRRCRGAGDANVSRLPAANAPAPPPCAFDTIDTAAIVDGCSGKCVTFTGGICVVDMVAARGAMPVVWFGLVGGSTAVRF